MLNNKIILGGLIVVLLASLGGIYFGMQNSKEIRDAVTAVNKRIDSDVQRLNSRTSPVVYAGEPVGYIIEFENGTKFYVTGDTMVTADMKLVIKDFFKPDVVIMPVGDLFVMGPEQAAYATSLIQPKYVIPYHYGSYPMFVQDPNEFFNALKPYNLSAQPVALDFKTGEPKDIMGVKVVWLGHATLFLISPEGKRILIDPSSKLGLWPEKYKSFTGFEKIDLILLTHGHPDHVVLSDLNRLVKMYNPTVLAPFELGSWLQEKMESPESVFDLFVKGGTLEKNRLGKAGFPVEKIGNIKITPVSASHSNSVSVQ